LRKSIQKTNRSRKEQQRECFLVFFLENQACSTMPPVDENIIIHKRTRTLLQNLIRGQDDIIETHRFRRHILGPIRAMINGHRQRLARFVLHGEFFNFRLPLIQRNDGTNHQGAGTGGGNGLFGPHFGRHIEHVHFNLPFINTILPQSFFRLSCLDIGRRWIMLGTNLGVLQQCAIVQNRGNRLNGLTWLH
jgi:hypothetical protein